MADIESLLASLGATRYTLGRTASPSLSTSKETSCTSKIAFFAAYLVPDWILRAYISIDSVRLGYFLPAVERGYIHNC